MSKAKPSKPSDDKAPTEADAATKHKDSARDTIESIVVAFILAFLFRTFEAEAFVIPTGSMAPTLFGRHKDVDCPQCGCRFEVGASEEVDNNNDGVFLPGFRIRHASCPNCRYVVDVHGLPVFKGDRILVNKFAYELAAPERWDVVVFKYPEDPKTNYIKRLVGLPNETIEIRQGDVYQVGEQGSGILRKPDPDKQRALQILVYDNDHPERALLDHGWPERWSGMKKDQAAGSIGGWSPDEGGWETDPEERSLRLDAAAADGLRWMRYRHIVPETEDWDAVAAAPVREPRKHPRPRLITDFCGYNATGGYNSDDGVYWVGDLTLSCRVKVEDATDSGALVFELVEGNRRYRCRFDLSTGKAELRMLDDLARDDDEGTVLATADTRVKGNGSWRIAFANVDDRLCAWVNDRLVEFGQRGEKGEYQPFGGQKIQLPWEEDLVPAGIAARGATVQVSKLLLERDIYYRGEFIRSQDAGYIDAGAGLAELTGLEIQHELPRESRARLTEPEQWGKFYAEHWIGNNPQIAPESYRFTMAEDEFFMMGDNSPRSKDSRLWPKAFRHGSPGHRHSVPRSSLVGKAFFIYWPHGVPFGNDGRGWPDGKDSIFNNPLTRGFFYHKEPHFNEQTGQFEGLRVSKEFYPSFRVPFYPNVGRMRRIR